MKQTLINYVQKPKSDEFFTPKYAIKPILKYLKPNSIIWCPFDKEDSNYVKVLKENGHKIIFTHIENGYDFLKSKMEDDGIFFYGLSTSKGITNKIDYIISNPPYSIKDDVLEHLFKLGIPFAMLMPITTLEGIKRSKLYQKYGIQLLVFDKRVNFHKTKNSNWFNTSYFMWKIMDKDIKFESLIKEF